MAAAASCTVRDGVIAVTAEVVVVGMVVASCGTVVRSSGSTGMRAGSTPSASTTRRRSTQRNSSRGATGSLGVQSCSGGSGTGLLLRRVAVAGVVVVRLGVGAVRAPERESRAHEQRFGCVHRAVEQVGNLSDRQPVEVAQGERGAVDGAERSERVTSAQRVEAHVPVVDLVVVGCE